MSLLLRQRLRSSNKIGAPRAPGEVTVEYLDLADSMAIAAAVTGLDVITATKVTNLNLADSALHAPAAGLGDVEVFPGFVDKAAVVLVHLAKNHPCTWRTRPDTDYARGDRRRRRGGRSRRSGACHVIPSRETSTLRCPRTRIPESRRDPAPERRQGDTAPSQHVQATPAFSVAEVDRCDECGFEYDLAEAPAAGPAIVQGVGEFVVMLSDRAVDLRTRRQPQTWSPLEYACHLRDVLLVQRERVLAARRFDRPSFDPMGRDERVEHDGYADQDADDVVRQFIDAAHLFANVLSRLGANDWERTVMYNYPTRLERSLRWVAVHTVHEVRHHLVDIRRQLA